MKRLVKSILVFFVGATALALAITAHGAEWWTSAGATINQYEDAGSTVGGRALLGYGPVYVGVESLGTIDRFLGGQKISTLSPVGILAGLRYNSKVGRLTWHGYGHAGYYFIDQEPGHSLEHGILIHMGSKYASLGDIKKMRFDYCTYEVKDSFGAEVGFGATYDIYKWLAVNCGVGYRFLMVEERVEARWRGVEDRFWKDDAPSNDGPLDLSGAVVMAGMEISF